MEFTKEFIESFWKQVDKNGECWIWLGKDKKPSRTYGMIKLPNRWIGAHRLSYLLTHGTLPEGRFICHICDTPPCVRPDHLYAGTPSENMADRAKRGRMKLRLTYNDKRYTISSIWQIANQVGVPDIEIKRWIDEGLVQKTIIINGQGYTPIEEFLRVKTELGLDY